MLNSRGANTNIVLKRDASGYGMNISDTCVVLKYSDKPGGPAETNGVKIGATITHVGDVPVATKTDLIAQLRKVPAGGAATFTFAEKRARSQSASVRGTCEEQLRAYRASRA